MTQNQSQIIFNQGTAMADGLFTVLDGDLHSITAYVGTIIGTLYGKFGAEGGHMLSHLDELFDSLESMPESKQSPFEQHYSSIDDVVNAIRTGQGVFA